MHSKPQFQIPVLGPDLWFPAVSSSSEEGIVAIGGDLSPERLLLAYKSGIFPWYNEGSPILWWSPDPRFVLIPENLKVSKSMRPFLNGRYRVTYNERFEDVMRLCGAVPRKDQDGTWINEEMITAYRQLHALGFAISAEVWDVDGKLIGGLYGIRIGKVFFGESMFSLKSNASKTGFISLVRKLASSGLELIDCQMETDHLASLGAGPMNRDSFIQALKELVGQDE